jgi:hypothetical protein
VLIPEEKNAAGIERDGKSLSPFMSALSIFPSVYSIRGIQKALKSLHCPSKGCGWEMVSAVR